MTPNKTNPARHGFTLIELLVVISIIAILAGMVFAVGSVVKGKAKISAARGNMQMISGALEAYYGKYHAYPPGNPGSPTANPLYYELSGVTNNAGTFITLDRSASIKQADYSYAFDSAGVLNSAKGGGEDAAAAQTFLPNLKTEMLGTFTTNGITATILVTSIGGPDASYLAGLSARGFSGNPFRYVYPGVRNPKGYDLWVQLVIKPGTTNLVCNWTTATQVNTADP